jgi:hypothetical protein
VAYVGRTAFGGEDPGAEGPGWVVADVLGVAALEVGDPVGVFVLVEGDDFALGHGVQKISTQKAQSSQSGEKRKNPHPEVRRVRHRPS